MSTRKILAAATALGVAPALLTTLGTTPQLAPSAQADTTGRPNIVLIVTDDQRVHTLGSQMTPHIWQIRREGALFSSAGTPTPLCGPSRSAILTGRYAHTTQVYSNGLPYGGYQVFEKADSTTIATSLHASGYTTNFAGKYINGDFPSHLADGSFDPSENGWDHFTSFTTAPNFYNYSLNDGTSHADTAEDYSTDVLAASAAEQIISSPTDKPLFLYYAPIGPHRPFTAAPRHTGMWQGRLPTYYPKAVSNSVADMPSWVRQYPTRTEETVNTNLANAQNAIQSIDDAVGLIRSTMATRPDGANTMYIYTSDNGLLQGEHHLLTWKELPYNLAVRIPMVVSWPGHIAANTTSTRLALNVDIAATTAEASGSGMKTSGLSLAGTATRPGYLLESAQWFKMDSLPKHPAYCGFRTQRYMFAHYTNGTEELYDYGTDPQELHNRAHTKAYGGTLATMRTSAWAACRPLPPNFHW